MEEYCGGRSRGWRSKLVMAMVLSCILCGCGECGVTQYMQLDDATNTGLNVLECRVNQRIWKSTSLITPGMYSYAHVYNDVLRIVAYQQQILGKGLFEEIDIFCHGVTGAGIYRIDSAAFIDRDTKITYVAPGGVYDLTITTLDTTKYIVAGTFNFNAGKTPADTTRLTDGRFDFTYN